MIVTQYGRPLPLPRHSGDLDDRGSHVSSALDQLRGYYGLGSASPSGPGPDYFRGTCCVLAGLIPTTTTAISYSAHTAMLTTSQKEGPVSLSSHDMASATSSLELGIVSAENCVAT